MLIMTVSMQISGMHCEGCVRSVEKAAQSVEGVSNLSVNLEPVQLTADIASPGLAMALKQAIEDCGFDVTSVTA
jgi:copper chaperone|tara:strand:+ start:934 stop:1155 length:222 start_codon:yes stop_codon:yes gene_type:complete